MKARLVTLGGRLHLETEQSSVKELFRDIAELDEIFSADSACGCCQSVDIHPSVRTVDGNSFYALKCNGCGAELSFGQKKDQVSLFPKRQDENKNWLHDRGWKKWSSRSAAGHGGDNEPPY